MRRTIVISILNLTEGLVKLIQEKCDLFSGFLSEIEG